MFNFLHVFKGNGVVATECVGMMSAKSTIKCLHLIMIKIVTPSFCVRGRGFFVIAEFDENDLILVVSDK